MIKKITIVFILILSAFNLNSATAEAKTTGDY